MFQTNPACIPQHPANVQGESTGHPHIWSGFLLQPSPPNLYLDFLAYFLFEVVQLFRTGWIFLHCDEYFWGA